MLEKEAALIKPQSGVEGEAPTAMQAEGATPQGQQQPARAPRNDSWSLYILECNDGTYYTGITKDLERRITQHNRGTASRYTRTRTPVKVIYSEPCGTRPAALVRECAVKALSRGAKEKLVSLRQ